MHAYSAPSGHNTGGRLTIHSYQRAVKPAAKRRADEVDTGADGPYYYNASGARRNARARKFQLEASWQKKKP